MLATMSSVQNAKSVAAIPAVSGCFAIMLTREPEISSKRASRVTAASDARGDGIELVGRSLWAAASTTSGSGGIGIALGAGGGGSTMS
jgi:hypothetical protein